MLRFVVATLIFFHWLSLFSQQTTDSLKHIVDSDPYNQQSLDAIAKLVHIYVEQDSPDSLFMYLARANSYLTDQYSKLPPSVLFQWAGINENVSDIDKANELYRLTIDRSLEQNAVDIYIIASNRLAYMLSVRGDYDEAIHTILKCLNYIDDNKLEKYKEQTYVYAAFVYRNYSDFQTSSYYFESALAISDSTNAEGYYHVALHELGNMFITKGNFSQALIYQTRALKLREKLGLTFYLDYSYNDIALSYSYLGDYKKSIYYYTKSIELAKKKKENWSIAVSYLSIGDMYYRNNRLDIAKTYLDSALSISSQYGLKANLYQVHYQFYLIHSSKEDFHKALEHFVLAQAYKDSIHGEESQKQISYLSARFQSEKKDKELLRNKLTIKRQNLLLVIFMLGGLVIFGFALWLMILHRRMKQYNQKLMEKNIQIENQKDEIDLKRDKLEKQTQTLIETNNALVERNNKINLQKEEIADQRDEIETQRDLLLKQKNQLELANQHLTDSIHYAENIQQTMLPSEWQFNLAFKEHFVLYRPLDIVSGDFYWLFREKGRITFAVADCTGHGVSGAFMSLLGISFLNEIIRIKGIKKPNLILDELRSNIIDSLKQDLRAGSRKDGMDIALCVYDTDSRTLHFSGANNPCWIVRNGHELIELKPDKNPVSIYYRMESFTTQDFQLQENDCIYLFTDGYSDQYGGEHGKKYQKKKLKELILRINSQPLVVQKELFKQTFDEWKGENPQVDDVTLLGVRV